ncbi:PorP/SprF family type IX secretion system membrane protein [Mucilaginibacter sp. AW1-3]
MKKYLSIAILLVLAQTLYNKAYAQQPFTFTQYMNNMTPVNTAYSTLDDAGSLNLVGRKQFIGIDGAPSTFLFNGAVPISSIASSAGLLVLNDKYGAENMTEINGFFAKKIQLSGNSFLSAGINAGFRTHTVHTSALDPSDPRFMNSDIDETQTNVGLSAMLSGSNYYVGVSLPRLTLSTIGKTAQENNYVMNTYYLTGAYIQTLNEDFKVKPAVLLAYAGNNLPVMLDVSTTLYIKNVLGLGVNYHSQDALAGIVSVNISNNIMFGYSYQFSVGKYALGGINNTTQELTLSYRFGKDVKAKFL